MKGFSLALIITVSCCVIGENKEENVGNCSLPFPNINIKRLGEQMYMFLTLSGMPEPSEKLIKSLRNLDNLKMTDRLSLAYITGQLNMDDFSRLLENTQKLLAETDTKLGEEDVTFVLDSSYTASMKQGNVFPSYEMEFYELYEAMRWLGSCKNTWKASKLLKSKIRTETKQSIASSFEKAPPKEGFVKRLKLFLEKEGLFSWENDLITVFLKGAKAVYRNNINDLWKLVPPFFATWKELNEMVTKQPLTDDIVNQIRMKYPFKNNGQSNIYQQFISEDRNSTFSLCNEFLLFVISIHPELSDTSPMTIKLEKLRLLKQFVDKYRTLPWFPKFMDTLCTIFENAVISDWEFYLKDLIFFKKAFNMDLNKLLTHMLESQEIFGNMMKKLVKIIVPEDVSFDIPDKAFI